MTLKEIYEKLETMEGGTELINAIKAEVAVINNEAAKHRNASKDSAAATKKLSTILSGLGLEDGDELEEKVADLKATLDGIAAKGGKPDEFLLKFNKMEKSVGTLQEQLAAALKEAADEKAKSLTSTKLNLALEELTKGNATNPKEIAKIIMGNISGDAADALVFKTDDGQEISVAEGVAGWLKGNSWAVKATNNPGSGAPTHNSGGGQPENLLQAVQGALK